MSIISDRHVFTPFVAAGSSKSKPQSGQMLLKVRFKALKDGSKARDSVCASVPVLVTSDVIENVSALAPYVLEMLNGVRQDIARNAVLAGADAITTDAITIPACIAFLMAESKGDRITGDDIRQWFDSELSDMLLLAFAEKLGIGDAPTDEQTATLSRMCNVYRDKFTSMAGGRTAFDTVTRDKLGKALVLCDCADGIGAKLAGKLDAMSKVSIEEMLGL